MGDGVGAIGTDRHFIDLIRRYVPGIKDVELSASPKQFSMLYAKRYDQVQLDAKMQKIGWLPVAHWIYAEEYHPRLLLLYQRSRPDTEAE